MYCGAAELNSLGVIKSVKGGVSVNYYLIAEVNVKDQGWVAEYLKNVER